MKRLVKFFSLLLISTFMVAMFTARPARAIYDSSKNSVEVNIGTENVSGVKQLKLQITFKYQRGFDAQSGGWGYKICEKTAGHEMWDFENNCGTSASFIGVELSDKDTDSADQYPTSKTFTIIDSGYDLSSSYKEVEYAVFVGAVFCSYRSDDLSTCQYYSNKPVYVRKDFKVGDILNINIDDIEDDELASAMEKITGVVYGTVMPVIYIVLTLFLIVKGTILGVQIVKAADEPQLRQEKIGSLKWLVIGCGIAYAASALVSVLTGFFSGAFNFS